MEIEECDKSELRKQIDELTESYLKKGGVIEKPVNRSFGEIDFKEIVNRFNLEEDDLFNRIKSGKFPRPFNVIGPGRTVKDGRFIYGDVVNYFFRVGKSERCIQ